VASPAASLRAINAQIVSLLEVQKKKAAELSAMLTGDKVRWTIAPTHPAQGLVSVVCAWRLPFITCPVHGHDDGLLDGAPVLFN